MNPIKYNSIEEAVRALIFEMCISQTTFSIYNITSQLRQRSKFKLISIGGVPQLSNGQPAINHPEVKNAVESFFLNPNYAQMCTIRQAQSTDGRGYREFVPVSLQATVVQSNAPINTQPDYSPLIPNILKVVNDENNKYPWSMSIDGVSFSDCGQTKWTSKEDMIQDFQDLLIQGYVADNNNITDIIEFMEDKGLILMTQHLPTVITSDNDEDEEDDFDEDDL